MAGYTDTEIETAVSQFVKSTVKTERDPLGPVDISAAFNEVIQLFSSTLVFDPNAIFYLIFLTSNRLNKDLEAMLLLVNDLEIAIQEMGRLTTEVTRTTLLGDAAAALLDVDRTLLEKEAISSGSFGRYVTSLDTFITASIKPNIKSGTDIVRPPQKARADAATDLADIVESWDDILARVEKLLGMLNAFNNLDLEVVAIQDSVRKARIDLTEVQSIFEDSTTTKDAKIAECRDAYLRLAAGKSVLTNYTTVTDPADPRMVSTATKKGAAAQGLGEDLGDVATVLGTRSGPWRITGSNFQLWLGEDGNPQTSYILTTSNQPVLLSGHDEDWDINLTGGAAGYNITVGVNDYLEIDGLPPIQLTPGTNRTALQISADIQAWALAGSYPYSAASITLDGGKKFLRIAKTGGTPKIEMTAQNVTYRNQILAAYDELLFIEGQYDSVNLLTAYEAAKLINDVGKIKATVEHNSADGEDGSTTSTTEFWAGAAAGNVPDWVTAGDQLVIKSGENRGLHRIASITRVSGFPDKLTVESDEPFVDTSASGLDWSVISEKLRLSSKLELYTINSALEIGTGNANSTIGLTPGTVYGRVAGFRVTDAGVDQNFTRADVVAGDKVIISTVEHTVVEVTDDGKQLEITPTIAGNTSGVDFTILSAAALAYAEFLQSLQQWDTNELQPSDFSDDLSELERVMNPLLTSTNPSLARLNDAAYTVGQFSTLALHLSTNVLRAFVVNSVPRMDAALKMLLERGLERAYDVLLDGDIATFFGMDKDDAGRSSYMLKTMRTVVQQDLPISKVEDDMGDIVHDSDEEIVDSDPDYDYSDADTDDSEIELGEIPDSDVDYGDSKVRY